MIRCANAGRGIINRPRLPFGDCDQILYAVNRKFGIHPRAVPIRRNKSASIVPAPPRQHRATAETLGAAGDLVGNAPEPMRPRTHLIDVQAVITHALKAAGLMKS